MFWTSVALWLCLLSFGAATRQINSDKWHWASRQGQRRCVLVVNVSLHFLWGGGFTILNKLMNFTFFLACLWGKPDLRLQSRCGQYRMRWSILHILAHSLLNQLVTVVSEMPGRIKLDPACIICCDVNICYGNFEVLNRSQCEHHVRCWWRCYSLILFL